MPKNISISFSGIICNLFNRLNRNTASRLISLFEMPIKKMINFARLLCSTIVLRKSSFQVCSNYVPGVKNAVVIVGCPSDMGRITLESNALN